MLLIYYRNKDGGDILRYHLPPKNMTPEQLKAEMAKFNEDGDAKVYCQEIKENSLEMFLYEKAQYRKRFTKEVITAALDAISEARDAIECLDVEDGE